MFPRIKYNEKKMDEFHCAAIFMLFIAIWSLYCLLTDSDIVSLILGAFILQIIGMIFSLKYHHYLE